MAQLTDVVALVEKLLTDFGLDPAEAKDDEAEEAYLWGLQNGSAHVFIKLEQDESDVILQVFSPILHLPTGYGTDLLLRLLQLNADLVTATFCVVEDEINLLAGRLCEGLDLVELRQMVTDVAGLADHFDNVLADEFGLELYSQAP